MLFLNVIVFCLIKAMYCDLSHEKPQENHSQIAVVAVGGNVTLECKVNPNDSVYWILATMNNAEIKHVFVNGQIKEDVRSMYRINSIYRGQFDLFIDSVDRRHAGKYSCKVFDSTAEFVTYLTVIDRDPICGISVADNALRENDQVLMWCEVNSTGFLEPIMKWTKGNDIIASSTKNTTAISGSVTTTSNTMLRLQSQDDNVIIQCTTSFHWPNGSQANIPEYRHRWQYLARVQYGVKNISIEPNTSSFRYGDQLECFVDGNPKPSYTWTHNGTSIYRQNGSVLTIAHSLSVGTIHVFLCTAQNTVDGKVNTISKSVSFYISAQISSSDENGNSTSTRNAAWISGTASVVVLLIIIVVILFLIILCVLCRTKTKTWLIMRFSSLQRKLSRDPDVLPRESSSRDAYTGGSLYSTPYSDVYHEVNDQHRFQIADVPLYNEDQAAARGYKANRAVTEDWNIGRRPPQEREDSNGMDFGHGLQMEDPLAPEIPRRAISKTHLLGADGTEYLDFGGVAPSGAGKVRKASPTFTPAETTYAMIDHRNLAPPLPPKKY